MSIPVHIHQAFLLRNPMGSRSIARLAPQHSCSTSPKTKLPTRTVDNTNSTHHQGQGCHEKFFCGMVSSFHHVPILSGEGLKVFLSILFVFFQTMVAKASVGRSCNSQHKNVVREPFGRFLCFVRLYFHSPFVHMTDLSKHVYVCSGAIVAWALLPFFFQPDLRQLIGGRMLLTFWVRVSC